MGILDLLRAARSLNRRLARSLALEIDKITKKIEAQTKTSECAMRIRQRDRGTDETWRNKKRR